MLVFVPQVCEHARLAVTCNLGANYLRNLLRICVIRICSSCKFSMAESPVTTDDVDLQSTEQSDDIQAVPDSIDISMTVLDVVSFLRMRGIPEEFCHKFEGS